jgi:hypothetical protein
LDLETDKFSLKQGFLETKKNVIVIAIKKKKNNVNIINIFLLIFYNKAV